MTTGNKVSIICVCYNQERFVKTALVSAIDVVHDNKEIIVVDDCSTDKSAELIQGIIKDHPTIKFIQMPSNKGNCAAFNEGFRKSTGDFLIDLAADDYLPTNCIESALKTFELNGEAYGVAYGDAIHVTESGRPLYSQHTKFLKDGIPQGDIYIEVIKRYFISSASMTMRRRVLEKLGGYDESLAYEDFDFWVRSSREFKYCYTNNVQVLKRKVKGSMSDRQFEKGDPQQLSTYRVCEKILALNKTREEDDALKSRVKYEMRHCLMRFDFALARKYFDLQKRISKVSRAVYR